MSKTIRPNQQTYEALDKLRGRLQATSPVHVSMSATVQYAVRIAVLALHETGDTEPGLPEAVIGKIAGRRIEGNQGTFVVCG